MCVLLTFPGATQYVLLIFVDGNFPLKWSILWHVIYYLGSAIIFKRVDSGSGEWMDSCDYFPFYLPDLFPELLYPTLCSQSLSLQYVPPRLPLTLASV